MFTLIDLQQLTKITKMPHNCLSSSLINKVPSKGIYLNCHEPLFKDAWSSLIDEFRTNFIGALTMKPHYRDDCIINRIEDDFSAPSDHILAHCVSETYISIRTFSVT